MFLNSCGLIIAVGPAICTTASGSYILIVERAIAGIVAAGFVQETWSDHLYIVFRE